MELLDSVKNAVRAVMRVIARFLNWATGGRISPAAVTITGVLAHIVIALLIATRHPWKAALLLAIFGLFDTLDGELARLQKRASAAGMLLDSITDRMKEVMLYSALAYNIIAVTGRPYLAVWAVAACGSSLLVSYVNAWGEAVVTTHEVKREAMINKAFRTDLASFEVRMFLLFVGLLSGRITLMVIVITILASLTAFSRLIRTMKRVSGVQN